MRMTEAQLRGLIREEIAGMGSSYAKKEAVKQGLQDMLQAAVASGEVGSAEELVEWWSTVAMASSALKGIPFSVWKSMKR